MLVPATAQSEPRQLVAGLVAGGPDRLWSLYFCDHDMEPTERSGRVVLQSHGLSIHWGRRCCQEQVALASEQHHPCHQLRRRRGPSVVPRRVLLLQHTTP